MGFDETDPTARRRWEPQAQAERDAEILRLYHAGVSQRDIAKMMNCSLGSVQLVVRKEKQRQQQSLDRELNAELDAALAKYADPELIAEDVTSPEQIAALDDLQYHRLRYLPVGHPVRELWGQAVEAGYRRPVPAPVGYPVDSDGSWRQGVDAALSDAADDLSDW